MFMNLSRHFLFGRSSRENRPLSKRMIVLETSKTPKTTQYIIDVFKFAKKRVRDLSNLVNRKKNIC